MITLETVRDAARRISPFIRRTPTIAAEPAHAPLAAGAKVSLKLECLQVSGSFKARGAFSRLTALDAAARGGGLVTASGGNHGIAIAYAAREAGLPATVVVPTGVHPDKAARIRAYGARLIVEGAVWDDANARTRAIAAETGGAYVHPFADPEVAAGQGTIALELFEDDPGFDTLLVAIGGGGLITGIAATAAALNPAVRIVGVEPTGAPTIAASLAAGEVVTLPSVTTRVPTLAARRTEAANFAVIQRHVGRVVLVEDEDLARAARHLWQEYGLAADLSGAAAAAALLAGAYRPEPGERVCAIVCGAGADGIAA